MNSIARRKHAFLLRRLAAGRISNDEYEDGLYDDFDRGSNKVFFLGGWYLYSDTKEYRLVGRHKLNEEAKHEVARWVLFLRSSAEYLWPETPSFLIFRRVLFMVSGRRWFVDSIKNYDAQMSMGDLSLWPFFDQVQYQKALDAPSYLHPEQRANKSWMSTAHKPINFNPISPQ